MRKYTDSALDAIQNNTAKLYAKLASVRPSDDLTRDDIRELMFCVEALRKEAKAEEHRRNRAKAGQA